MFVKQLLPAVLAIGSAAGELKSRGPPRVRARIKY